jgi:hypothetical protein
VKADKTGLFRVIKTITARLDHSRGNGCRNLVKTLKQAVFEFIAAGIHSISIPVIYRRSKGSLTTY